MRFASWGRQCLLPVTLTIPRQKWGESKEKGPAVTARPFAFGSPIGLAAVAARAAGLRRRADVRKQLGLLAHDLVQGTPCADFIAPRIGVEHARCRSPDTDRADELVAVDDDRQAAGIGEIAEGILPELGAAPQHAVHRRLAR